MNERQLKKREEEVLEAHPVESTGSRTLGFLVDQGVPFVKNQWKPLAGAAIALPIGIWLLVNVGWLGTLILVGMIGAVIYAAISETPKAKKRLHDKKRLHNSKVSRERKMLWLEAVDKEKRTGKKPVCPYCKEPIRLYKSRNYQDQNINVEHKTPSSREGSESIANKHLVHSSCNQRKATKTDEEYHAQLSKTRRRHQSRPQSRRR